MTSTAILAQGTVVKIATGTGGAKTVTGVAVGYPTILTCTSHGFSAGDVITFDANFAGADAALLNSKTFTVIYKTTNTYALAVDTTGKTITAGTAAATPTTFTAIANVRSFNNDGGSVTSIDKTNFDSTAKEFAPGLIDFGQFSFEVQVNNGDAGQAAIDAARASQLTKSMKVILPSGTTPTATFDCFVLKFSKQGSVDGIVTGTVDVKITGEIVWS